MNKLKKGFTIIEVLLAMAFLSLLILMIGYVIYNMINIYNKGMSIKDVNKTADLIISDIQNSVANSGDIKCAIKYDYRSNMATLSTEGETCRALLRRGSSGANITGGALCTGKNTYLWNYGDKLQELASKTGSDKEDLEKKLFRYKTSAGQSTPIRVARIRDDAAAYCSSSTNIAGMTDNPAPESLPALYGNSVNNLSPKSKIAELVEGSDRDLALHSFSVTSSTPDVYTNQALYEIEFVLGTFHNKLIETNDVSCKNLKQATKNRLRPDGTIDESEKAGQFDLGYCAVNKFNFATRAVKGKGKW